MWSDEGGLKGDRQWWGSWIVVVASIVCTTGIIIAVVIYW
jgi:hypothetical protein